MTRLLVMGAVVFTLLMAGCSKPKAEEGASTTVATPPTMAPEAQSQMKSAQQADAARRAAAAGRQGQAPR